MRYLTIFLLAFLMPFAAQADNIYEIKNVSVVQPGTDAGKVREKAMMEAEKKAFEELQKRLIAGGYVKVKMPLTADQITSAVDAVDVVSEKIGTKDYRATFDVTFSSIEVSRIFSIGTIAPTKDVEKYMVVPVIISKNTPEIWKNDWWKNWDAIKNDAIVLPLGDLQDIKSFRDEDLQNDKLDGALRMQQRYGANNIVIIQAEYIAQKKVLEVQLEKLKGKNRMVISYEYPADNGISQKELLDAAAADLSDRLVNDKLTDENYTPGGAAAQKKPAQPQPYSPDAPGVGYIGDKQPAQQFPGAPRPVPAQPGNSGEATHTDVFVTAPDLIAWNRIRNKLVTTPGVSDLQIKSFTAGRAYVSIGHNGDITSIKSALSDEGLVLTGDGQNWEIKENK